jgi:hypothetical protein
MFDFPSPSFQSHSPVFPHPISIAHGQISSSPATTSPLDDAQIEDLFKEILSPEAAVPSPADSSPSEEEMRLFDELTGLEQYQAQRTQMGNESGVYNYGRLPSGINIETRELQRLLDSCMEATMPTQDIVEGTCNPATMAPAMMWDSSQIGVF